MIVDTSAMVAVLMKEPGYEKYLDALLGADAAHIGAATYVELGIVADRKRDPDLSRAMDDLLRSSEITIDPLTEAQVRIAREAYRDYGKGSGHPARLNFGDCFAYALARDKGEPLLFKGADFSKTDVRSAIA